MRAYLIPASWIFCFCAAESTFDTQTITIPQPGKQLNFTFTIKNEHFTHTDNRTTQTLSQPPLNETPLFNKINKLITTQKEKLSSNGSSILSAYKWHLLAAALAGSYAYLCYCIISGNAYLSQSDLWSSWRADLPLDQLLAIPQAQFAQELLREIQRRYTDAASITDLVRPLALFMTRIEQEEEQIKWYQYIFSWIAWLRLDQLVPVSKIRFTKTPERLQRLAYYKNVFQSWAADYQFEQTQKTVRAPEHLLPEEIRKNSSFINRAIMERLQHFWLARDMRLRPSKT